MARLQSMGDTEIRTLTVIWPVAIGSANLILSAVNAFREENRRVQWLVKDELHDELLPFIPASERSDCHLLSSLPVQSILANIKSTDVILVAGLNFQGANQILGFNDEIPWIHILLQGQLAGNHIAICEDLLSVKTVKTQNPVAMQADALKRQLAQTGYNLVSTADIARQLKELTLTANHGVEKGGLLTEIDVENLSRSGHKEVRLHSKTIVTPLAESRISELGLHLVRLPD